MHRALPVGNKVCAARARKRYEEQRAQRLRDMKGQIDNTQPQVMGLRHLKTNWKKAEMLGQRYDTIERDNRHLLNHMNSIGTRRDYGATRSQSLPLLRDPPGGPLRQRETDRINQENALILKRLQSMQAEYKTREWEDHYRQSQEYIRIKCEYPPPLLPKARTPSRTSLTRLPPARDIMARTGAGPGAVAADPLAGGAAEEERFWEELQRPPSGAHEPWGAGAPAEPGREEAEAEAEAEAGRWPGEAEAAWAEDAASEARSAAARSAAARSASGYAASGYAASGYAASGYAASGYAASARSGGSRRPGAEGGGWPGAAGAASEGEAGEGRAEEGSEAGREAAGPEGEELPAG